MVRGGGEVVDFFRCETSQTLNISCDSSFLRGLFYHWNRYSEFLNQSSFLSQQLGTARINFRKISPVNIQFSLGIFYP